MRLKSPFAALTVSVLATMHAQAEDPLPSWNEGPTRNAIVRFVERVTREDGPDFIRPAERIAVFDNDGTLWSEKPVYCRKRFQQRFQPFRHLSGHIFHTLYSCSPTSKLQGMPTPVKSEGTT